ncbi:MAG: hypothetical protein ACO3NK_00615, partial [Prochlorotrichaceae cyanobacterium]
VVITRLLKPLCGVRPKGAYHTTHLGLLYIFAVKLLGAHFASRQTIEASHGRKHYAYDPLGNRIILYEPAEPAE